MGEFISWCCSTINYYITCSCCSDPPKCQKCGLCKRCCCKCDDNDDKNIIKNEINEPKLTMDTDLIDDNNNIYKKNNDRMKASFMQNEEKKERKGKNTEIEMANFETKNKLEKDSNYLTIQNKPKENSKLIEDKNEKLIDEEVDTLNINRNTKEKLIDYENEMIDLKKKLDDKEKELNKIKNELNNKENELKQFKNNLIDKDNESLDIKNNLIDEEIDKIKKNLNDKEYELGIVKNELSDKENKLNEAKKGLNDKLQELNDTKSELDDTKKKLDDAKKDLINKEKELEQKKEEITSKFHAQDEKVKKLENENQELKKNKDEFINKYKEKEKSLNEKEEELLKKNQEYYQLDALLKQKEKQNSDIFIKLNLKEKELIEEMNKLRQKELSLNAIQNTFENEKKALEINKLLLEKQKQEFINSKIPNTVGLQNIGATCYMNATLQALSNTDKFTEYFLNIYHSNPSDTSKRMSNEMYKVLYNLWSNTKKTGDYAPNDFKTALSEENPLFAGVQANDSKDLINFLLERFHHELNNPGPKNNTNVINAVNQLNEMETFQAFVNEYFTDNKSIITDCFYGLLETKSKCSGCNYVKFNFQIYSFLEFPLMDVNKYMYMNGRKTYYYTQDASGGSGPDVNLYECFDYHQKVDYMNGLNQMYCNICSGNRDTCYNSNLYSLPNYLIINLNRGKGAVYKCNVKFPETLNLLNYVSFKDGITTMKLYAVICHLGPSSMSGHFIAYCKHRQTHKWYCYNDSAVTECKDQQEFYKGMPYILFYQAV